MVELIESRLRDDRGVVPCPAPDHRVDMGNQRRLWCCFVTAYYSLKRLRVPTYGFYAGLDDGLEPEQPGRVPAPSRLSRVRFAHGVLAHVKPEKVEAHLPLVLVERVGYSGLAR